MLRLCYGLNRYSADLDFWVRRKLNFDKLFLELQESLSKSYTITDKANKFHAVLFEIKSVSFPRRLKIEIRKPKQKIISEQAIAFSQHSTLQVLLNTVSLKDMMNAKIQAFIDRKEIRDAFDMEFLIKKGIMPDAPAKILEKIIDTIASLRKQDYTVVLGSVIDANDRKYYTAQNFKILKTTIQHLLIS